MYPAMSSGSTPSSHSISGHWKLTALLRQLRRTGGAAAALAYLGEAPDCVELRVLGRKLERVHTRIGERRTQLLPAFLGERGKALAKTPVVRVDEELLAGFRVPDHQQAQVGQVGLDRVLQPHRD